MREVIGDASNKDIISVIQRIKRARENDNSTVGMISTSTDFRQAREEKLSQPSQAQAKPS